MYHGSGADFDAFDFGHMGEGEGAQAFGWGGYVTEVEDIGRVYAHQKEDTSSRMLYTIDIPQDNGRNYLHWEKTVGENAAREMGKRLYEHLIRMDDNGLYDDEISRRELRRKLTLIRRIVDGAELYGTVAAKTFYKTKKSSAQREHELMNNSRLSTSETAGASSFVGAKIPKIFESASGKMPKVYHDYSVGDRDKEYLEAVENGNNGNVIPLSERFNESDPDVRFFRTKDGEAYGFTVGGKIYIDPRYVNAETPIHEYAHLWAEALRRGNAEEWRNVIELMRGTSVWDEVREQYSVLKTEDAAWRMS